MTRPTSEWPLLASRILMILWAGFWTWFGLASGIGERLQPIGVLIHTAVPGLFFGLLVLIAWRWPTVGGFVLLAAGVAVSIAYPILFARMPSATRNFVLLTMAAPPLVCGILLLFRYRLQHN
ncbi:MAG: hypothetical protein LLG20_05630 [Acidobacteriales bacterium]|nr:hypothetical protein [Terriglobales bacterium]